MPTESPSNKRLSVLDIAVFLLLLLLLFTVLLRLQLSLSFFDRERQDSVQITFLISDVSALSAQALHTDQAIYLKSLPSLQLGTLSEKEESFAKYYLPDQNGVLQVCYSDSRRDVLGKIDARGRYTENGFFITQSKQLAPGLSLAVQTDSSEFVLLILDIEKTVP